MRKLLYLAAILSDIFPGGWGTVCHSGCTEMFCSGAEIRIFINPPTDLHRTNYEKVSMVWTCKENFLIFLSERIIEDVLEGHHTFPLHSFKHLQATRVNTV